MAQRSGCYNCSQRRIKCDRTIPECVKCIRKGIQCTGYGVRYRFNHGVASRGKFAGCIVPAKSTSIDGFVPKEQAASSLLWPDGTLTSPSNGTSPMPCSPESANLDTSLHNVPSENMSRSTPISYHDLERFRESWFPADDVCDFTREGSTVNQDVLCDSLILAQSSSTLLTFDPRPLHSIRNTVPPPLELIDARTRQLLDHFSSEIAPIMVVLDCQFNGYRNLILPLACEDPLVKAAVCVASLYHLAFRQPEMQHRAEAGFQSIVGQLRRRTSSQADLIDIPAWTTLIILLTGETITGGSNLRYLFKILQHLAAANMQHGRRSVMQSFLIEQTRMMTLFAQPLLEETAGAMTLTSTPDEYFDFVSNAATFLPGLTQEIEIYKTAIRSACNIYLTRATIGPPHSETVPDLDRLVALCEQIHPDTPGHHTLVWAYFIAAAESSTLEHRQFFTIRLQEVFSRTKFQNIPTALVALQKIWKVQPDRRWTEILSEVMPVFII